MVIKGKVAKAIIVFLLSFVIDAAIVLLFKYEPWDLGKELGELTSVDQDTINANFETADMPDAQTAHGVIRPTINQTRETTAEPIEKMPARNEVEGWDAQEISTTQTNRWLEQENQATAESATLRGVNKGGYPFIIVADGAKISERMAIISKLDGDVQFDQKTRIHLKADGAQFDRIHKEITMNQGIISTIKLEKLDGQAKSELKGREQKNRLSFGKSQLYEVRSNFAQILCDDGKFIARGGITLSGDGVLVSSKSLEVDSEAETAVFDQDVMISNNN